MPTSIYLTKHRVLVARDDNHIMIRKFGANLVVSTSEETLWTVGGLYTGFLTAASAVRVASGGSANDDAAGTHARKIFVSGLDENWDVAQEEVTLAGASASAATTTTFIRVNRVYVSEVGAYGNSNSAAITIETTGGATLAEIATGIAQTEMAVYTVPNGYIGFVTRVSASSESTRPVNIIGHARLDAGNTSSDIRPARTVFRRFSVEAEFTEEFTAPDQLPAKTDIWLNALRTSSGAGNAAVYAELDINLVKVQ